MDTPTTSEVATRVLELMTGWTEKGLAEETGIPRTTLRRRLSGKSPFTLNELDAIADAIGVSVADLLGVAA